MYAHRELILAAVASRSSLVGALLRTAIPSSRESALNFLRGLSRGELECLAEFQGSWYLEAQDAAVNPYRLLPDFFDASSSDKWKNPDDRAHKTFVVLAWIDQMNFPVTVDIHSKSVHAA